MLPHKHQLDRILLDALFCQELKNLGTLIPLKLDDSPHILVLNQSSIACELLLELFKNLLIVVFFGEALKRSQRLSSISLLDANMNISLFGAIGLLEIVVVGVKGIGLTCEVLDAHTMSLDPDGM